MVQFKYLTVNGTLNSGTMTTSGNINTTGRGQTDWYNINTGSIGAWSSIYSYGRICAGNASGDCMGAGGTVIRSDGVQFPDGSVQTTAVTGGGITAVTTATCTGGGAGCTATCPAGYFRTGCSGMITYPNGSAWPTGAQPSGTNACFCRNAGASAPCYAYCAK